jgi:CSLREA domain-containing protein
LATLVVPASAAAAEFVVTTTDDGNDQTCNSHCTLREAVTAAAAAGTADSITVPPGTYLLNQGAALDLAGDAINGAGARSTIIDAGGDSRVFTTSTVGEASPSINGVTIRGGSVTGAGAAGEGGGILTTFGTLSVTNSHIVANSADRGGGIAVGSGDNLLLIGSTVASNTARSVTGSSGGGIWAANENQIFAFINSTITGNVARDTGSTNSAQGGGIWGGGGGTNTILSNVTLGGNEAVAGGGIYVGDGPDTQLLNSLIADNTSGGCGGPGATSINAASHHNLVTDGSCALTGPGNVQGVGAQIGALANNGGPTDTRALAATSPAINAASGCASSDQRGIARPAACDIGAFEYVAPVLTVTTTVVNDDGGEDGPAVFTVHVRNAAGNDVGGSPQAGNAGGTSYVLAPGGFRVAADGPGLYTVAFGGACAADGSVALGENQTATCTITANDRQPRAGREVAALPAGGRVRIKKPGGRWEVLLGAGIMPNGTRIDTRRGRITMIAPANRSGRETKADFYDGIFQLRQSKARRPTTTLTLIEKLRCPKAGTASIAAKRKKKRRLWGDGSGRFRTKGKHSAATVVGTKWLVEDRCSSTLTRVVRGRVKVRDFAKKKTITVRKGKRYIARAR